MAPGRPLLALLLLDLLSFALPDIDQAVMSLQVKAQSSLATAVTAS